jgi:FAD/FMN-containing dehydrogenase
MTRAGELLLDLFPESKLEDRNGLTVLCAEDENDVTAVVNLAVEHQLKLCPAGSMTHLALSEMNCIVVSSSRMNRVVEYSAGDLYITLQSGIRLSDVNSLVANEQLMFAFGNCGYPGTIGGAVAMGLTAQLGGESIHIKRWVPSLSFVTPYGKHIKVGAVTLKSVAGYDITKLLVGSAGRFGFITSITLRLIHRSQKRDFSGVTLDMPGVIHLSWKDVSPDLSTIERNLKKNLDPHEVFPSLR